MHYPLEKRNELIEAKPADMNVRTYCGTIGISYATYYKWYKEYHSTHNQSSFIDVTNLVSDSDPTSLDLEINNITIHVKNDYDENHLLCVLRSLKKL